LLHGHVQHFFLNIAEMVYFSCPLSSAKPSVFFKSRIAAVAVAEPGNAFKNEEVEQ